ncbi:XTP/dITP diphosphatase [Polycladomyces subterraneus]|uniref:dITP/XTP pyrophosphatase n=1 Tax=Polycladomyces subterraneus TaxID=1016997 RepID=A0ABT8IIP3_9BACL|nr:XTP/dITP diphosphatase [Polycladomyces subterraneus]MDN4592656.1 XTP/dITP diphosphatase [Polycladomyces subterraneus]
MKTQRNREWRWSEVVLATRNRHKTEEFDAVLRRELGLPVVDLTQVAGIPDVVEDGDTFEANAIKKAETAMRALDRPVIADDSGLVVPALNGAPGVYSARYAGSNATDEDNNRKLLAELNRKPEKNRDAMFVCVIALAVPGEETRVVRGECHGRIVDQPRGEYGFGYDPLFFVPEEGKTMAELSPERKNEISHRARAIEKLLELFRSQFAW